MECIFQVSVGDYKYNFLHNEKIKNDFYKFDMDEASYDWARLGLSLQGDTAIADIMDYSGLAEYLIKLKHELKNLL